MFPLLQITFAKNVSNAVLCTKTYKKDGKDSKDDWTKLQFLKERIHESYMQQWVIDNMPVTWCYSILESNKPFCTTRFPVGCYVTDNSVRHDACYLSVSWSHTRVYTCRYDFGYICHKPWGHYYLLVLIIPCACAAGVE